MYMKTDNYLSYIKLMMEDVLTLKESSQMQRVLASYKEVLHRMMTNRFGKITEQASKILLIQ
jgi:hypothetical protein